MKILVIGGTGTVGSRVVAELRRRSTKVRCLVRSSEKAKALPKGVEGVIGDLDRPETLAPAMKGIDSVFLLNALGPNETRQGLASVETAKAAGAGKIVYLSVYMPEDSRHIPHFRSKIPVEAAIGESGMAYTILRPNNFFQNDLWFRDSIVTHGIYPHPLGSIGLNRVDVRDIAEAAVNSLLRKGHDLQEVPLHGPDTLNGEGVARTYSRLLGIPVRYLGDDLNSWSEQARRFLPEDRVADLRVMFEYFQKRGFIAGLGELDREEKLLGHPPRNFESFVSELAGEWKPKVRATG